MLGGGDFVSFFGPRGQSFALKSCALGRDFDRKNSGLGGREGWQPVKLIPKLVSKSF